MSIKGFCVSLVFILFLSLVSAYGDTNVLINPGFEDGTTTGWSDRNCSITTISSPAYPVYNGSFSGKAFDRTDTWQGIKQSVLDKMMPGETYQISGWVRLEEGALPDNVGITVEQLDSNGTQYIPVMWSTGNDYEWTPLSGTFTLNVTGTLTKLDVYFEGPAEGVAFYVDDAVVYGPEPVPPPPPDPNATGEINGNIRYQEIEGFGASGSWFENWLTGHPKKNEIYDVLFGQLGLDIYRLRNNFDQSGDDEYMTNSSEIITEGELSLGRPLKVMISSWSPPDYLKSEGSTVGGTLKKDAGEYCYIEFAEWWANSLDEWSSSYGVDVDYVNIQNEPDYLAGWDSCKFTHTETIDWAGYNLAFEAVYNELNARMGSNMPKMLAADAAGIPNCGGYLDNLIDYSHVYGYSHHLYNIGSGGNPDAYIYAMNNFASQYGYKPLMQTEFSHNIETFTDAMNLALLMHNSLTVEGVSAYLYWDLFWGYGSGLVTLDWPFMDPCDANFPPPSYTINPVYYAFKHYSAFVHSGWQRVETQCDNPDLRMSTYINPNNRKLSVVLINTTTETDIELDLSFTDITLLDGNVYRSSQTENCVLLGSFDPVNPLILPAQTITTLALDAAGTPPVAVAGPNQVVYAWIDGLADVNLDGSDSYDDDGDPLIYYWSWTIGGNVYEASGVSPVIELPVGEHQIKLIVDDGINESGPNYCTITVVGPLKVKMFFTPSVLNTQSHYGFLVALISLPKGITPSDIDDSEPLLFIPGDIKSESRKVFCWPRWCNDRTYVWPVFDKSECIDHLSVGFNVVKVVGKLKSGQYYYGSSYLRVVPMRWGYWWPFFRHNYQQSHWGGR